MNITPTIIKTPDNKTALAEATRIIRNKWPEALSVGVESDKLLFRTGIKPFDGLFPTGGIPYGQLIELTGDSSSGKTSLLLRILAGLSGRGRTAYVDTGHTFFCGAAEISGVDLSRLVIARPDNLQSAARTTELLLQHKLAGCIVFDLVGQKSDLLEIAWCHRLRARTVRARGLVIFVTQNNSNVIPPSMISLRLQVNRLSAGSIQVTVTKSRICPEGAKAEVILHEQ